MNTLKYKAENIYNQELKKIYNQLGTGLTYGSELAKLATKLFGSKFKGVYSSDEIDNLKAEKSGYFIYNLDARDEPGSHWIGIVKKNNSILVYDSFGRSTKVIAPNIYSIGNKNTKIKIADTEYDAEQKITEEDCGSRVISFLKVYDEHGSEVASLI